jgi:3-phenylpropionate/cinnamic acid dioxygenase small subunit
MTDISAATVAPGRHDIEDFLKYEVELLDDRRFEEWMELFTVDGFYWVPTEPDQKDPYGTASLFFDDRSAMRSRFARLRHPRVHVQIPPSRTCHFVSNVRISVNEPETGELVVHSKLLMLEYRPGYEQRVFGGNVQHRLQRDNETLKIAMKRVTLLNCDATFGSLAIPF